MKQLLTQRERIIGVLAEAARPDGTIEVVRIEAEHIFVCCGPTETPALLRRSGVHRHVGDTLRIHPMLKMIARFPELIDADRSVLPLIQVKEFAPEITLGGAFFTPGHAAMILSENWDVTREVMADVRRLGAYYVAVRGAGTGSVRPSLGGASTRIAHELCDEDVWNLSKGLARLALLLLEAGAEEIYPAVHGLPSIRRERDAVRWLDDRLPREAMALTTVHAFSSCPMGERADRCAVDSFGRVFGFENLYVNDASMLPDSPGVNPQATVMAFARRNAIRFHETNG